MIKKLTGLVCPPDKNPERLIAIGDIHGQYDLLVDMVEDLIKFDQKSDVLVFMGDYIDRGATDEDEVKVVNYLVDLVNANPGRVVLLRGNHEQMALDAIADPNSQWMKCWLQNGVGDKLLWDETALKSLHDFCKVLPITLETENHLFVHAGALDGIPARDQDPYHLMWDRYENQYGYHGKILVVGHTPRREIVMTPRVIGVDTGAFYTGTLAAYDIKNGTQFYAKRRRSL